MKAQEPGETCFNDLNQHKAVHDSDSCDFGI